VLRQREPASVTSVDVHAAETLQFIRQTMERSSTFSAVPGIGGAVMGAVGLAAAALASQQPTAERWLAVWLVAAVIGFTIGVIAIRRKAARLGSPLIGALGRRFALSLAAPFVAGAALTFGLWMNGIWALMPPTWLLLYGTGQLTGGVFSVAPMRLLGLCFMGVGVAALVTPAEWGNAWLAVGFGALHVIFGIYIARHHGG
jgi:hypothetical protein